MLRRTPLKTKKGFKQKTYLESKNIKESRGGTKFAQIKAVKKKLKKPKLPSISILKKRLWKLVSDYIRERDNYVCFTSGAKVAGSNAHCGHMYPSSVSGVLLRYHPHNLACQSYVENIHHSGNGAEFYQRALAKYGKEKMDRLKMLKQQSAQGDRYFYNSLIELYKQGNQEEIIKFLEGYL